MKVILIKRYLNGRLYNTDKNCYIKLPEIEQMILNDIEFKVITNKSKEDITKEIYLKCLMRTVFNTKDLAEIKKIKKEVVK